MCESNDKNLTIYYVLPDEQYRPDLLAYRMWGIAELRWVVTLAAGLEDESQGMTVGKIKTPTCHRSANDLPFPIRRP